jgi:hypothetical protein
MMVAIMVGLHAQDNSVLGMILFLCFFVNLIHPTAAKILTVAPRRVCHLFDIVLTVACRTVWSNARPLMI